MVRFARAIGSKSSNKRVPEDATPWTQLNNAASNQKTHRKISWKRSESFRDDVDPSTTNESLEQKPRKEHKRRKPFVDDVDPSTANESLEQKPRKEHKRRKPFVDDVDPSTANESLEQKPRKEHKRRKPLTDIPPIIKDGEEIGIVRFDGFPVRKQDADRLKELRKDLLKSKIPRAEIKKTLKLERRRAEKALAREKKKLCFHCRNSGHVLSECPELDKNSDQLPESGICFKCGSTEHQHTQCKAVRGDSYKYATCFICKEAGHISKQCPDNPRGLYPDGGGCRTCGDVTHLKKDCPKHQKRKKEEFEVTASLLNNEALDALDEELSTKEEIAPPPKKKKKIIRM